ncbi:hypothetical protein GCM10009801_67110 [Streptomyces albiaxialis]|uniref:DUF397 domain-containing protein n=1 Tax=Streptomyces albiaxialis TaxID=329523 RepID=A0ABN2WSV6_9ACTN
MTRSEKRIRRLVVGEETFLWSVRHSHRRDEQGRNVDCAETLTLRRHGARGRLRLVFRDRPGKLVPDGYPMFSGAVGTVDGPLLNLHEPGTVRAALDEALARGWDPDEPSGLELDGWAVFEAVAARRA